MKNLSKYKKLWEYLEANKELEYNLSFDDIKNIIGFNIDHSFLSYKKEAEIYGYKVKKISLKEKMIVFEKNKKLGDI